MRGRRAVHAPNWFGAIAQLGERLHGMQEVSGSIPLGSTNGSFAKRLKFKTPPTTAIASGVIVLDVA